MAGRPARNAEPKAPRIVEVALERFIADGYRATSMETIATAAGMSKQTLYRYFADKEALFSTVVRTVVERSPIAVGPIDGGSHSLRETLIAFGEQVAASLSRDEAVGIFRMVIAEAGRQGGLGQQFYEEITAVAAHPLARRLAAARDAGAIAIDDPFASAVRLIAVLKEHFLWPRLLGRKGRPQAAEVRRTVADVVDTFLRGHALPRRPPRASARPAA